jgi:hypothetical protein
MSDNLYYRSTESPDELLLKSLAILSTFKNTLVDPWDYLINMLKRNSFKSELLILSPEKIDKSKILDCLEIITRNKIVPRAIQRGGIIEILIEFILCCVKIHVGWHKFEAHKIIRTRVNQTTTNFNNQSRVLCKYFNANSNSPETYQGGIKANE